MRMKLTELKVLIIYCATALILTNGTVAAQEQEGQESDCQAPEFRALDFRLGNFKVTTAKGIEAGWSRVESALSGCLLVEQWQGSLGVEGRAFMFHDRDTAEWHMHYIADDGESLSLRGTLINGVIVFTGQNRFYEYEGMHRMYWALSNDGEVQQKWVYQPVGSDTWEDLFAGTYERLD